MRLRPFVLVAMLGLVLATSAVARVGVDRGPPRPPSSQSDARLEQEIARLSAAVGGEVGVAARVLESGRQVAMNRDARFPMASTFKVAVAATILSQVDAGLLSLGQIVPVRPDQVVDTDGIARVFPPRDLSVSVEVLLEAMLTQSDNTATDVLVELAGGPAAVTGWVRGQGILDLSVDRDTAGLIRSYFDLPPGPVVEGLRAAAQADPQRVAREDRPKPAFDDDPRDTSTPEAMLRLLSRIYRGEALSRPSTERIRAMMQRCATGQARLRGRLPPGTVVLDKTGTLGGSLNDVGVVSLPNGLGHLVIVVFIKKSPVPFEDRERLIADIGRAIYDFMLFASP